MKIVFLSVGSLSQADHVAHIDPYLKLPVTLMAIGDSLLRLADKIICICYRLFTNV